MRRFLQIASLAVATIGLAACGSSSPAGSGTTAKTVARSKPSAPPPSCPVSDGGSCLGRVPAGTHTTGSFRPKLTYRVPSGWANYADQAGTFLLTPAAAGPPGNSITSDFISAATSVAAETGCTGEQAPGVGTSPAAIAAWLGHQRGLVTSRPQAVRIGGLPGEAVDIRMRPGAKGCIPSGATKPAVPLLVGIGNSSFDHEIGAGVSERDYLLRYGHGALGIEVIDASGGSHLPAETKIVRTFRFGSAAP